MRGFLGFSAIYLAVAFLLVEAVRGDGGISALTAINGTLLLLPRPEWLAGLGVALLGGLLLVARYIRLRAISVRLLHAVLGTACFLPAFALVKTLLPEIVPFYADPPLAAFDTWLHGGIDPWRLTHDWSASLPMAWIEPLYVSVWGPLALLLPILMAVQDSDEARVRRYLILYTVAWVGFGNVLALAGMSAGPVFYDRLVGEARFAELNAAIDSGFLADPSFTFFQEGLWDLYNQGYQIVGTGISAFPSVHVAMACVVALYAWERVPRLGSLELTFVTAILFLSVYTGYHYAIDGYVSIAGIGLAWAWLQRREAARYGDEDSGRRALNVKIAKSASIAPTSTSGAA